MQFTTSAAACLALISRVFAQTDGFDAITYPTKDAVLDAGSTYKITWDYNAQYPGTISISLLEGASSDTLEVGATLANDIDSSAGSYSWTVGSNLGDEATYAIKINLESDPTVFQYSFPFEIAAPSEGGSSSIIVVSTSTYSSVSAPFISAVPSSNVSSGYSGDDYSGGGSHTISITSEDEFATFPTLTATGGVNSTAVATDTATGTATGTTTAHAHAHAHAHVTKTTLTSVVQASPTESTTTLKPPSMATSGGGKAVAGVIVAMGGLAMALLVL